MPGGDRTGPAGMGPMTGRRAGYCVGNASPGTFNTGFGRGYGLGFGRGFRGGRGAGGGISYRGYSAPFAPWMGAVTPAHQELEALQAEANSLRRALETVTQRITELEARKKPE